ncbi:MAG TPA: ABC transporter ATP-binding protein [Solirubrobacteraceae bacterium]|nr:ABC transporter ATP-binding protein [Solirubrobacteraceae bacterium]
MTELVITDLHKAFGTNAVLSGVELTVPAGSLTAILGPSGSGKTTLLRLIAGFERSDRGTIELGGTVVDAAGSTWVASERRRIGYVPQEGSLFPHLTVRKNIGFGLPRGARDGARVDELLALIGMEGLGARYPHQLSGGQQQRVALARALATRPELVLLDEPFSSLDPSLRSGVRADVKRLLRAAGATALLVTHDQDEALSLADRVAVIRCGRVCQCDTPQGLYDAPTDTEVAGFVGEANLVPGVLMGGWVRTAFGELSCHCRAETRNGAMEAVVLIRPEQVKLRPAGPGSVRAGHVLEREYHGHDSVVRIQPGGPGGPAEILARISGHVPYEVGSSVTVTVEGPVLAWCVEAQPSPASTTAR